MYRFILLVFVFFISIQFKAQRNLDFEQLSMNDGFTSNRANAIIQDQKGYIWIGTWNGLNRYDGYECKKYIPNFKDSSTITNREVVALYEDSKENIWIGTTSGLNCLNPKTGKMTSFSFQFRIIALNEDSNGYIWVGTTDGGLYILNPATKKIDHFFGNETISDICEDNNKNVWLASYSGLIKFDYSSNQYKRFWSNSNDPNSSIPHNTVTQIKKAKDGSLWLSSWGGGLSKFNYNEELNKLNIKHYNNESLPSNAIVKLYIDSNSNIWCGTWDAGICLLSSEEQSKLPSKAKYESFQHDSNKPKSISGNNISALFIDKSGILWVGTEYINYTSIVNTGVNTVLTDTKTNGSYNYRPVRSVAQLDNNLLVGTTHELKIYQKSEDHFNLVKNINPISYVHQNLSYQSSSILSMAKNNDGLWIATDDAGLILYPDNNLINQNNPKYIYFNTNTTPRIPGNKVTSLVVSKNTSNTIWLGTLQNGVASLHYKDKQASTKIITRGETNRDLSDNNIRALLEDKDGLVWIGTQNGLNCYNPKTQNIQKFFHSFTDTLSINDNVINCIFEDSSGNLWVGSNSGLNKKIEIQLPNGERQIRFKNYSSLKRVGNNVITNILEDNFGLLWIKPYRGLVKFNPQSERVIKDYLTKEYLKLAIERNCAVSMKDGTLVLGGNKGFIYFHPDSVFKQSSPPSPCITDFMIFNNSIHELESGIPKDSTYRTMPYKDEIHLSFNDKVLTIMFSAMDYKDPDKNRYAYFLDGYDKMWNEVGSRNTATYTNIPPGNYTFHVKAANSDGVWSHQSTSVKIIIASPWWKTIWAYIAYAFIIVSIMYFFKRYSIIGIKEKGQIMLESLKVEKEHKLNELKTLFFTDITHEFRTPLTLIQGPAEDLLSQKEVSPHITKQAELILKNTTKLLRLVNQLMDFRKIDKGKMEIFLQHCNVTAILNDLYESYIKMAHSRSIAFKVKLSQPAIDIYADSEKIEKILFNLVSNAFKYTDDGGTVSVQAALEYTEKYGEALVIEVEDDGIGIAEQHHEKVFERFYQTHQKSTHSTGGIGLYLSKTFVEQHGGIIELQSELGKGTIFKVVIPANINQLNALNVDEKKKEDSKDDENLTDIELSEKTKKGIAGEYDPDEKFKVLVVEDDSDLNDFIVTGLSAEYNTLGVFNGKEGFEQAKSFNPDIIITDVMMPELNGFDLVKLLREDLSTSHIPVIFLTAKTLAEYEIKGLELGAVDYIFKPFHLKALKLRIFNVLSSRKDIQHKLKKEILLEPEKIELSSLDEKVLKDAVDAVNKHIDDPTFDVEKFSEVIGLSANQAYRKIKALTGQTVKEFIRNQRLKTAASLLVQNKRSISEVIYMVGFSSPSYFSRCFKDFYNCTPKEYIAKHNKN